VLEPPTAADLEPGRFTDSDHPTVVAYARKVTEGATSDVEQAVHLFADVRDRLRYDPYRISDDPTDYLASVVLGSERAWCVPKATLLTAAARAAGIPARIGFSDVRNHLTSDALREAMGTDLFAFHGYSVLHVGADWHKVSPAFNAELCERFGVPPVSFDGSGDALLHAYDGEGRRHMEYVHERGIYHDLPFEDMLDTFRQVYGRVSATGPGPGHDPAFH